MKICNRIAVGLVALASVLLTVPAATAHHAGTGFGQEVVEVTGVIKEFQFTNPHSWIQVNVTGEDGKTVEWWIEWGSPNQLGREGIRPSTFPAGAKTTIRMRPMTNGTPVAAFVGAKMADGRTVGNWN